MTTFKNVFDEYINQDEIYEHVVNRRHKRMSLKPAISICMIILVCLVGKNFLNEKSSSIVKDATDKVIINSLSDNYIVDENSLIYVQANPSISNLNSFYETHTFIQQLEKNYDWNVYYAQLQNEDDLKTPMNQDETVLFTVIEFVNNQKEIEVKISNKDITSKFSSFESSIINDTSIIIYKNIDDYNALYEKDGLYHEVKSLNLNEKEFIEVLKVILEK